MPFLIMRAEEARTSFGQAPAAVPMAICDICEGAISDADLAMYAWDQTQVKDPGFTTPYLIVHKGQCREAAEARIGPGYGDHELTHLLECLVYNTRARLRPFEEDE